MLNRGQIQTMLILRNRENNIFSQLPVELIDLIGGIDPDPNQDPNSDIAKALCLAAYGQENDLNELKTLLDANPQLVFEKSNAITPTGLDVRGITLYEFAIGAGDPVLVEIIKPYFSKIPNGEVVRLEQEKRYKLCIEDMLNQPHYDLTWLINVVKKSSLADVTAELNHDKKYNSQLHCALIKFREDIKPGILQSPRMHCNYQNLIHALEILANEWNNLVVKGAGRNSYDKCNLVWRQVIGYIQLKTLPACDRQAFAQGLNDIDKVRLEFHKEKVQRVRSFKYRHSAGDFPSPGLAFDTDSGVGFDSAVDMDGWCMSVAGGIENCANGFKDYIMNKQLYLTKLIVPQPIPPVCYLF